MTRLAGEFAHLPDRDYAALPAIWRAAPHRWGHPMHSMCSYMAMFPPTLPRVFVEWLTEKGDVCYDPFSGRGTTGLEARLLGRVAYLSDASPLAWLLSSAKVDTPTLSAIDHRLDTIAQRMCELDVSREPDKVRMLFSKRTLGQLLWLRSELDLERRVDRFVMATLAGVIHARADSKGVATGLTVPMPNTFSMAPGYIRDYIAKHALSAPDVDVVPLIRQRAHRLLGATEGVEIRGSAWLQDVRRPIRGPVRTNPAKLIFTSPPYLGVMKYGKLNWIRLWLLGREPGPVDEKLFSSASLPRYRAFMSQTITNLRSVLRDDGYLCLVVGDVRRDDDDVDLSRVILESCLSTSDLRLAGVIEDSLPIQQKVSRIWGGRKGRATKTDRIILLRGPRARVPGSPPSIEWAPAGSAPSSRRAA